MRYTVVWKKSAEDRLAEFWLDAPDRDAVTRAARQIDVRLRHRPQTQGESRTKGRRILLVSPLGAKFEIHEDDRIVRVLSVWHFVRR